MDGTDCTNQTRTNSEKKIMPQNPLSRVSSGIVNGLQHVFYTYGVLVSRLPVLFILICLILTTGFSIGLINFTTENRPFKLWIPQNSEFIEVLEWQKKNFPNEFRIHMAIYEAENVLDKSVLLEMLRVHEAVANASTASASWDSVCAKMPSIIAYSDSYFGRRKRSFHQNKVSLEGFDSSFKLGRVKRQDDDETGFDISTYLDTESYCQLLESMQQECMEHSVLEVWGYDHDKISALTPEQIIADVNTEEKSAVFGFPTNFTKFLGKVERNEAGQVVKAGASRQVWLTRINLTAVEAGLFVDDSGTGMEVDTAGYDWEKELINVVLNDDERPDDISVYLMVSASFGMISSSTITEDAQYLALGFSVMFIYVFIMLGNFNSVEQRPILSMMGLCSVGMSILLSYGICSACSVPFGPVNNVLPFLLLGLGVDDMFVIMEALNNLSPQEKRQKLTERIGLTLKHAGVSITVTSVTDFAAFIIGSGTVLPALRSFCIYAAVVIAAVYFFQATFFVAWLSLDQHRLEDTRHGFLWCWKLNNWTPNQCSQKEMCHTFFKDGYAKYLFRLPVKVTVLIVTAVVIAVSGWGLSNLEQEFNPIWFLPQNTYLYKFFMKQEYYYPTSGEAGTIYFGKMNYSEELHKIDELMIKMKEKDYIGEIDSWYLKYKKYWEKQGYLVPEPGETEEEFLDQLGLFLHSPSGSKYRAQNFHFDSILNCTAPAPPVAASSIEYTHRILVGSQARISAMDDLKSLLRNMNFSGYVRAHSRAYSGWETDKIIEKELYRNMGLAMMVVFIVTLVLIANLLTSVYVLLCVVMTLIDVGALMHWWGLTIDTVSCIDIVLAIGLCVDYAAHVGHTFMTKRGTRDERARQTVATIGLAVLNGGFSTVLAFIFLANSNSHVFITFFKIFFGVTVFGLFHGLVFLPVLLSLIGPASYVRDQENHTTADQEDHTTAEVQKMCLDSVKRSQQEEKNGLDENRVAFSGQDESINDEIN